MCAPGSAWLYGGVGYAGGLDLRAGASYPGGFAWSTALFPLGLSGRLGDHGLWGVVGGVAGAGITGRLDAALAVPAEAYLAVRAGRFGVSAWVRPTWIAVGASRRDGATSLGAVDELYAGIRVRLGRSYHRWGFRSGNGYHLGLTWSELAGTRLLGVTVGYDLDVTSE